MILYLALVSFVYYLEKYLPGTDIKPSIKQHITGNNMASPYSIYITLEAIEKQEFEDIIFSLKQNLIMQTLARNDVEF